MSHHNFSLAELTREHLGKVDRNCLPLELHTASYALLSSLAQYVICNAAELDVPLQTIPNLAAEEQNMWRFQRR
jgi:hypothetical protein